MILILSTLTSAGMLGFKIARTRCTLESSLRLCWTFGCEVCRVDSAADLELIRMKWEEERRLTGEREELLEQLEASLSPELALKVEEIMEHQANRRNSILGGDQAVVTQMLQHRRPSRAQVRSALNNVLCNCHVRQRLMRRYLAQALEVSTSDEVVGREATPARPASRASRLCALPEEDQADASEAPPLPAAATGTSPLSAIAVSPGSASRHHDQEDRDGTGRPREKLRDGGLILVD
jgi:hypothetical protein